MNVIAFVAPKSVEDIAIDWLIKMDGDKQLNKQQQAKFSQWMNADLQHSSEFFELCEVWDNVPVEEVYRLLTAQEVIKNKNKKNLATIIFQPIYGLCGLFMLAASPRLETLWLLRL